MAVTIYDVAKKAKVGIGTVSRVINNSPHISPTTKDKVLKVINELKYQPHAMAQGLASKRSNSIACIVPDFTSYFFVELLRGIQQEISKHGYDLILYCVDELDKKEVFLRRTLREKKVDGVLLLSMPIEERDVERFHQSKLPLVLVDSYHPKVDSITVENEKGAYIGTSHLIEIGHKKVAIITGEYNSFPVKERISGYKRALQDHNIPFNEKYLVTADSFDKSELLLDHGFNKMVGYISMQSLIELDAERPTATFIASDIQAIGALRAISEKGLTIPDDMAIVGFDDIELAEWVELTTMSQPKCEIGKIAVDQIMNKISGNNSAPLHKSFLPELIIRRSSGTQV